MELIHLAVNYLKRSIHYFYEQINNLKEALTNQHF